MASPTTWAMMPIMMEFSDPLDEDDDRTVVPHHQKLLESKNNGIPDHLDGDAYTDGIPDPLDEDDDRKGILHYLNGIPAHLDDNDYNVAIADHLDKEDDTFRLSGSSARPAYPGFMVMNMVQEGSRTSSVPSNTNVLSCAPIARCIVCTC